MEIIIIFLLISVILLMVAVLTVKNEERIIYTIEPKNFVMRLRLLKLHLSNTVRTLNRYLQDETTDEDVLVQIIEQSEFQIKQINDLITHYGDVI